MKPSLEVLFSPAEFTALAARDLAQSTCVVFDVLRATSTMLQALSVGASGVIPVATIAEALAAAAERPQALLVGERHGRRIDAAQTGGRAFDLGNSPREFTPERVQGRTLITTTTNGTRALQACRAAAQVRVGAFLNLDLLAARLLDERPSHLVLVCSGTGEEAAYEDTLAAGALCERLLAGGYVGHVADSARMAATVYQAEQHDLSGAMQRANNAVRLLAMPDLREDVAFCLRRNAVPILAGMDAGGVVRRLR